MRKINHSKYKNTGFLFEILIRQVTVDTIEGVKDSKALSLIKKYFNKNTELYKEYNLYSALMKDKFVNEQRAQHFIDKVVSLHSRLDSEKLRKEKYNLVKEIKEFYNLKEIFSTQINDYKVLGSIYTLFQTENIKEDYSISHYKKCNETVLDFVLRNENTSNTNEDLFERYSQQDKEIRLLAYKLMIEKFNKKYSSLNKKQKNLLKEYINNISNTNSLREYVNEEVDQIRNVLQEQIEKTTSNVTKIKLSESMNLLNVIKKGKTVKDNQLKSMLYYYELIDELRKVNG
jgi:hypothetical protein